MFPEDPDHFDFEPSQPSDRDRLLLETLLQTAESEHLIQRASELVSGLNDRSMEITSTDLDLSCIKPIYKGEAVFALKKLASIIHREEDEISDLKNTELQSYIRQVISTYRNTVFNIITGIKPYVELAHSSLLPVSYRREIPREVNDAIEEGKTIMLIDNTTFPSVLRTITENELDDFVLYIHTMWAPMFDDPNHKKLAKQVLRGEIDEPALRDIFDHMNAPVFATRKK
jgi:hypothetical protein